MSIHISKSLGKAAMGAVLVSVLGLASANADVLFSDSFPGPEVDPNSWVLSQRSFEYMNTSPTGTLESWVTDGITMQYTADSSYWPGATYVTTAGYPVTAETPVTFEIQRNYNSSNQASGVRCAILIYNSDLSKWVHFSEFSDGGNVSSSQYYGWGYNRYIGADGDNQLGAGLTMEGINLKPELKDQGSHRVKLVSDGATVSFYLDDTLGATVPFPFTDGVRFGFGVYARAAGDFVEVSFGDAVISGTANLISFDKDQIIVPENGEENISVRGQLLSSSQDEVLTLTSANPEVAAFSTGASYNLTMKGGVNQTYTVPLIWKGTGRTTITASNTKGIKMNPSELSVIAQSGGEELFFDDFAAPEINPALWEQSDRSFEYTGGGTPTGTLTATAGGALTMDYVAGGHYWPGSAFVTKGGFNASTLSPLVFEVDRESFDFTATGGRCGVFIYNEDMSKWVFFNDVSDGGDIASSTYLGWRYNRYLNETGDSRNGTGTDMPLINALPTAKDKGKHALKVVANGKTVSFYLDGVKGAEVSFPVYGGIRFGLAVFGRYEGDLAKAVYDNARVMGSPTPLVDPVTIVTQPRSRYFYPLKDTTYEMSVTASGTPPLAYQWYYNGEALEGETGSSLVLDRVVENAGAYSVEVSNEVNSVRSEDGVIAYEIPAEGSYEELVVNLSPRAYWRLGETEGTVANEYLGNRNGTYTEDNTLGKAGAIKDDLNAATGFGGNGRVLISPAIGISSVDTVTMAVWVKPDGVPGDYTGILFSRGSDAETLGIDVAENQICYHWMNNYYGWRSGLALKTGEWNFVAMAIEPTGATFYLGDAQGNLSAVKNTNAHGKASLNGTMQIGGDNDITRRFKGDLDEAVIFVRTLDEEEIFSMYNAGIYGQNSPVEISAQPQNYTGFVGDTVTLSVKAAGSNPVSYQWYRQAPTPEGEWVIIENATTPTVSFVAEIDNTGNYRVEVTNPLNSVTSETASVQISYTPTSVDLSADLWSHLKFDGDYSDASGHDNGVTPAGEPTFETGVIGNALHVKTDIENGIYNFATFGFDKFIIEDRPLTVAFWTKVLTPNAHDVPWLCNNYNSYGQAGLTLAPSWEGNGWSWSVKSWDDETNAGLYGPDNSTPAGEWSHLVYVLTPGQTMKVYLNGHLVSTTDISNVNTSSTWLDNPNYSMNIGQDGTGAYGESIDMLIDDMGIWRVSLDDIQARSIYYAGKNGNSFDKYIEDKFPPAFVSQPVGLTRYENEETFITLSTVVSGTEPVTVTWLKDGQPIDAEGTAIQINCAEGADGNYSAIAKNAYGEAKSDLAPVDFKVPTSEYEALVVSMKPWSYWRLGEAAGIPVAVEYANGLKAAYNANTTLGQTGAIADDTDTAVSFDGTSFITAPDMDLTTETVTMLAWIKPNGIPGDYTTILFDRGHSAAGIDIAGGQVCYHWNDTQYAYRSGLTLKDNEWNMVALVVTPTEATFYLGDTAGNLTSAVNTVAHGVATLTSSFSIGGDTANPDRRFNGTIDEPVVFNRALSASQIIQIYNKGIGKDTPVEDPTITWQFEEDGTLNLYFTGTLEVSTDTVNWETLKDATSPYELARDTQIKSFYRTKVEK